MLQCITGARGEHTRGKDLWVCQVDQPNTKYRLISDKAYDTNRSTKKSSINSVKRNRKVPRKIDKELYKLR